MQAISSLRTISANGKQVNIPEEMYEFILRARRSNRKVLLTTFEPAEGEYLIPKKIYCENCSGAGKFALRMIYAGPFKEPPPYVREASVGDYEGAVLASPTYYNKAWYQMTIKTYQCPMCGGRGIFDE